MYEGMYTIVTCLYRAIEDIMCFFPLCKCHLKMSRKKRKGKYDGVHLSFFFFFLSSNASCNQFFLSLHVENHDDYSRFTRHVFYKSKRWRREKLLYTQCKTHNDEWSVFVTVFLVIVKKKNIVFLF